MITRTVKELLAELAMWADDAEVWHYQNEHTGVRGIAIWSPDSTQTEPEHVIELI